MTARARSLETTIDTAWQRLAVMMAALCASLPADWEGTANPFSRAVRLGVLRLLRPAEALARRLILTMARELRLAAPKSVDRASKDASTKPATGRPAPRNSGFSLSEPMASLGAACRLAPASQSPFKAGIGPRILTLDSTGTMVNTIDGTVRTPRVKIRLMALLTAMKDPAPLARRLARRLLKARAAYTLRRLPLRPGRAPGWSCRHTPDWLREALSVFTREARGWPPPPDRFTS